MKKILLLTSVFLCVNVAFAQKKAVKEAKANIAKTAEARELIKPALTDIETAQDQDTWLVAGNIEFKAFEDQHEAEMTKELTKGKGWDQDIAYSGIYNMVDYYKKADELGQKPDEKGKTKNKVRKDIIKNIKTAYPFYINAGVYYNDLAKTAADNDNSEKAKQLYSKAADLFQYYWDIPNLQMFEKDPIESTENTPIIKYYAVICAIQAQDDNRAISLLNKLINEPYVTNDTYKESDLYEYLAETYKKAGDSINYIETLKLGSSKYPTNKYFTPNYINELLKAEKYDAAIEYLDQAVSNDPSNLCDLASVKASLLADKKNYKEAITIYDDVLSKAPECGRAIYGIGVVYILEAEAVQNTANQEANISKQKAYDVQIADLYMKSLPHLEKYKKMLESDYKDGDTFKDDTDLTNLKQVLIALNSAYYNLNFLKKDNMQEKYNQTEKELNELKSLGY